MGMCSRVMQIRSFYFYKLIGVSKLKIEEFKKHTKNKVLKERIALFLVISLLPTFAYAYGSGGDEVTSIIQNLCAYLSGTVAKAIGILAIIFMGYKTLSGRMDWRVGGTIAIGLGLIIGGAYYGGMLLGNS